MTQLTPALIVANRITPYLEELPATAPSGDLYHTGHAPRTRLTTALAEVSLVETSRGYHNPDATRRAAEIFSELAQDAPAEVAAAMRALAEHLDRVAALAAA